MTTRGGAETGEGLAPGIGGTIVPGAPRPSTESKATPYLILILIGQAGKHV